MTRSVLVTGASGFIGAHTLPHLQRAGCLIHAVSRRIQPAAERVHWHTVDLLDDRQITELIARVQPTDLLHLAWNVQPGLYWTTLDNFRWVQASLHLLQAFYDAGGQRAVLAGTCAEYDWKYGYCVEDLTPLSASTPYSACRASLYRMAMSFAGQTQLSLAWGRIFFPFGPGEHPRRLVPSVIRSLLKNQAAETSHGEQLRDFLFVDDLAAAFVALLHSDVTGAVNLASGTPVRLKEIIMRLAAALGKPHLIRLGARPASDEPPLVVGDVSRLRDEVGWTPPTTLDDALARTIAWWQRHPEGNDENP